MPEGIHPSTPEAEAEAIRASRERRKQVAKDAAAKRSGKRSGKGEQQPTK